VTQTAEADVNRASTKVNCPLPAEKGNQSRMAPSRITTTKLKMKILAGESCLARKVLGLICIFTALDP
jgi:hypothetical protein